MAITISITESGREIVFGIPEYITFSIDQPATIFYTIDGSAPDPSGQSLATFIVETEPSNHLVGVVFLPRNVSYLTLNVLAVGVPDTNVGSFYRRYGLEKHHLGSDERPIGGGSIFINMPSENITEHGHIIAADGYTTGYAEEYEVRQKHRDGYRDEYGVAVSGEDVGLPPLVYDHIDGYGEDGSIIATSILTPEQEQSMNKLSDRGNVFIDDGSGLTITNTRQIDPRSTTIIDDNDRRIEVVPIQSSPTGYTTEDGYLVDDDFDDAPVPATTPFTSGGIFDPRASFIQMDGRIDGYMNGQPILPGDRIIINKPFQEMRYSTKREDLGNPIRGKDEYISGGISTIIFDYNKGQAAFYYFDHHDNRYICSLQKITSPNYEQVAQKNGVVVGQVFAWTNGRRTILPG